MQKLLRISRKQEQIIQPSKDPLNLHKHRNATSVRLWAHRQPQEKAPACQFLILTPCLSFPICQVGRQLPPLRAVLRMKGEDLSEAGAQGQTRSVGSTTGTSCLFGLFLLCCGCLGNCGCGAPSTSPPAVHEDGGWESTVI